MSGYYPYGQNYNAYYYDEWIWQLFAGLMVVVLIFSALLAVVFYVFRAIGLYRIAKRRTIRHAWLAWIPVASEWIMGSISDQYQYVVKGQIRNRRILLTVLSAVILALSAAEAVLSLDVVAVLVGEMMFGNGSMDPVRLAIVVGLTALCFAVQIAYIVFYFLALYDLYSSCTTKYNVLFLILGVFFRFLDPFFIFSCREKDEGMPPRRIEPEWLFEEDEIPYSQGGSFVEKVKDLLTEEVPEDEDLPVNEE